MEWIDAVRIYGLPGLIIVALYLLARDELAKKHTREMKKLEHDERRIDLDEKRADMQVTTLTGLISKIDAHAVADIQSHQSMATGIAGIHGKLDEVLDARERTPIEGVSRVTPPQGVPVGIYGPGRPGAKGGR